MVWPSKVKSEYNRRENTISLSTQALICFLQKKPQNFFCPHLYVAGRFKQSSLMLQLHLLDATAKHTEEVNQLSTQRWWLRSFRWWQKQRQAVFIQMFLDTVGVVDSDQWFISFGGCGLWVWGSAVTDSPVLKQVFFVFGYICDKGRLNSISHKIFNTDWKTQFLI